MQGKPVITSLVIALLYVAAGKAALLLALPPGYASAVFPPAGIAIAAAFIAGRAMLPGVFLGSMILNTWVGYEADRPSTLAAAALIALASVLQAHIGGGVLRRAVGYPAPLDNMRDIASLLLLLPLICLVAASLSVAALWGLALLDPARLWQNWATWWIGDTLGAMVVFPAALALVGEPRELWRGRIRTVVLPMLVLLALIAAVFLKANQWDRRDSLSDFQHLSERALSQVNTRLDEQSTIALEMSGMFLHDQRGKVTRVEFFRFSRVVLAHFPMLQALEWAPRVTADERSRFEAAQRRHLAGFHITEIDGQGTLQPAAARPYYYPVTFVEPIRRNEDALGFDLASNPERAEAIARTAHTGVPAATAPIPLVQKPNRRGILIVQSVSPTGPQRAVVLTVLNIQHFMDGILPSARDALRLRLIDDDARAVIYDSFPPGAGPAYFDHPLTFASRHYHLQTTPTAAYLAAHRSWQSWSVLALGTFGAALFGALLLLATGYTAGVVAQVNARTRELQESEARFRAMADNSPMFIWLTDRDNRLVWFNQTLLDFTGRTLTEELQTGWTQDLHPEDAPVLEAFSQHAERQEPFRTEFRLKRRDGAYRWIMDTASPRFDKNGNFMGYIGSGTDITEQKQALETVARMAHYDTLTGLPNRAMFMDRLSQSVATGKREHTRFALLFIDIDNFKPINDRFGHHTGDELLIQIAARMKQCIRESDTVARIGGDEFVAILHALSAEADALQAAEKIRQALCQPFEIDGQTHAVSSSIGAAIYPEHGRNEHDLMRNADHAMYLAKNRGRNQVVMFRSGESR
jgi:diguanylate cyclase (GGDEF)-like protein/PAS domain S-box-containing protein